MPKVVAALKGCVDTFADAVVAVVAVVAIVGARVVRVVVAVADFVSQFIAFSVEAKIGMTVLESVIVVGAVVFSIVSCTFEAVTEVVDDEVEADGFEDELRIGLLESIAHAVVGFGMDVVVVVESAFVVIVVVVADSDTEATETAATVPLTVVSASYPNLVVSVVCLVVELGVVSVVCGELYA